MRQKEFWGQQRCSLLRFLPVCSSFAASYGLVNWFDQLQRGDVGSLVFRLKRGMPEFWTILARTGRSTRFTACRRCFFFCRGIKRELDTCACQQVQSGPAR